MITLRPYQVEAKNALFEFKQEGGKRALMVLATGTGKRLMAVEDSLNYEKILFVCHSEELIEQAMEEFEKYYPMQVGVVKASRFEIEFKVTIASAQTLHKRLDRIPKDLFDLCIIDECFIAGTLVDGHPIENIGVGAFINSFNHEKNKIEKRKVIGISKKKVTSTLYKLVFKSGESFVCTEDHPIFINNVGYVKVKDVSLRYKQMSNYGTRIKSKLSNLWEGIRNFWCKNNFLQKIWKNKLFRKMSNSSTSQQSKANSWKMCSMWKGLRSLDKIRKSPILLQQEYILFSNMQESECKNIHGKDQERDRFQKNEPENERLQSNGEFRNEAKDDKFFERSNILKQRRKWRKHETANDRTRINQFADGICNYPETTSFTPEEFAEVLQSRSSLSRSEIVHRDRWENSQVEKVEVLRQKEDRNFEFVGLDSIKVYKRRGRFEFWKSSKEDYVYNLEVEENNNYFANSILVHNCHLFMAKTYLTPFHYFTPKMLTGWTATPTRLDGLNMNNLFDKIVYDYPIQRGIKEGYLCKLDAYRVKTNCDLSKIHKIGGDFNQKELSDLVDTDERNKLIVEKYREYADGRQTIVNCINILHAERLRDAFREANIVSEVIVSDEAICPNRKELVNEFKEGNIQVITNVTILSTGFDYSNVSCVIQARPTQSLALYMQQLGRGTRIKSAGCRFDFPSADCIILDIVDVSSKHDLINTWTLEDGVRIEDRIFMSDKRKEEMIERRDAKQRELAATVNKIIKKDEKVALFPMPISSIPAHILFSSKEATEKQIQYMKAIDVFVEGNEYTLGQAMDLISNTSASAPQIWKLNQLGYDVSKGVTRGQAKLAFDDAEARGLIPKKEEKLTKTPFIIK